MKDFKGANAKSVYFKIRKLFINKTIDDLIAGK